MSKKAWKGGTSKQSVLDTIKSRPGLMAKEITTVVGFSYQCVKEALKLLQDEGAVYVCGWKDTDISHTVAMYAFGSEPNVPKPSPDRIRNRTSENLSRRIQRGTDDGALVELQLELEIERKAKAALAQPAFRHWMDVALYGPAQEAA